MQIYTFLRRRRPNFQGQMRRRKLQSRKKSTPELHFIVIAAIPAACSVNFSGQKGRIEVS